MATHAEKLEAIRALKFPKTLKQLETYLRLLGWFREHVYGYAAVVRPLQDRKTAMLRDLAESGANRKRAPAKMFIDDGTLEERAAFDYL